MSTGPIDPIRLAIPSKGHLYDGIVELLKTAGYKVRRASDRQYEATIVGHGRFHVVFMRPTDIVIQVQEGRCHLGVTGMDVFAEHAVETEQAVVVVARPGLRRLPAGRGGPRELDRRQPHHRPGRPDDRVQDGRAGPSGSRPSTPPWSVSTSASLASIITS